MLAVHWTPVSNTKSILKNGITKSQKGLFCFPLTGHKFLDRWWLYFFNQCGVRARKQYNGIVFRLRQQDMPAYFGHWVGATNNSDFKKEITDLKTLGKEFRDVIAWRLGEEIARNSSLDKGIYEFEKINELYLTLAENEIKNHPKVLIEKMNSLDFMSFAFEDYQIVLSNSITSDRIIKVIPQGNEFGRVLKPKKVAADNRLHEGC
jgi:hypothetical protein